LQRIAEVMTDGFLESRSQDSGGQVTTQVAMSHVSVVEEPPDRYMRVGQLHIDTYRHEVSFAEKPLHLTPTEYMIVACLAATPGRVVSYGDIVRSIRGYEIEESEAHELLRTHIRNLRRKVDRRYVVSVYAVGYMLDEPDS
jgi:DNA-binding response OmpR family regulator